MFTFLKNHPFPVEAFFESSIVLTFAIPKEDVQTLIPECLELDTFDDKWAFIAVAMVQTRELRPKGFPKLLGSDFILVGYRIFVKYTSSSGKRLRGLYILKSETDKKKMQFFGNIFTHYNYTTTDINLRNYNDKLEVTSLQSDFAFSANTIEQEPSLPEHSPFKDWKEARRFAGPLPFTFYFDSKSKKVLIIEGVRENWKPQPIKIIDYKISFISSLGFREVHLANAFIIKNILYHWKKGRVEKWSK
jgi:uncharacterized protein YqjF (DUF2071 family)